MKITGQQGETAAAVYLEKLGYIILKTNYRIRTGEIDIIAKTPAEDFVVFIEVKARKNSKYGLASEAVDIRKQKKIINTALSYIQEESESLKDATFRFDVIEVYRKENVLECNHIINAFLLENEF
ncbi:YraN family protein [Selenomonadales bacterium OttesenSCG-928-I06]|nr:YraN family protein [Selenomonadales bacterium OttesenSCG-928-I06]